MSIIRATAHAFLATPFIVDGISAAINPDEHAEKASRAWEVAEDWGAPRISQRKLRVAARASGVASAALGSAFVFLPGKRLSAAMLSMVLVPMAAVNTSLWLGGDKWERKTFGATALYQGATIGGLLLAAVDLGGKPSLKWRRIYKDQQKQAVAAARARVGSAA